MRELFTVIWEPPTPWLHRAVSNLSWTLWPTGSYTKGWRHQALCLPLLIHLVLPTYTIQANWLLERHNWSSLPFPSYRASTFEMFMLIKWNQTWRQSHMSLPCQYCLQSGACVDTATQPFLWVLLSFWHVLLEEHVSLRGRGGDRVKIIFLLLLQDFGRSGFYCLFLMEWWPN